MFYTKDGEKFSVDSLTQDEIENGELKVVTDYFKNGKESSKESYIEVETTVTVRLKHGEFISYDQNGFVDSVENYKNNELHGLCKSRSIFGDIRMKETHYENGVKVGNTIEELHPNGKPSGETIHINENEKKHITYYENGTKESETHLIGYTRISREKWFDNGEKRLEEYWDNEGKPIGDWYVWFENGELLQEQHYTDGIPDGDWYEDTLDGNTYEQHYSDGKKNGRFTYVIKSEKDYGTKMEKNYRNDKLHGYYKKEEIFGDVTEGNYKNGRKEGEWNKFHRTKPVEEETYKDGKLDGLSKYYSIEDGKLFLEKPYKDGKLNGVYRRYDKEGNVEDETYYLNDKETKKPKKGVVSFKGVEYKIG
jgi:antitoxin component YwqK of YwqJK toxin-antitoxin module